MRPENPGVGVESRPGPPCLPGAHLFVFSYAVLADVTPPVAVTVFAGAQIAGAGPMITGLQASRIAIGGFLAPFLFVSQPALLTILSSMHQGERLTEEGEEGLEDLRVGNVALGLGVVALLLEGGRNSMVVTKNVRDSQMDSKWQPMFTGRAQDPIPSMRRRISVPSSAAESRRGWMGEPVVEEVLDLQV